ncbi:hypothetical protein RGUI_3274 [Rhodovulum sp. P5]|uniref:hypothetical protein n=1 Tax=Rhodovulum sp. P5 TaxID=1564506 RepID=UPI0009C2D3D3|nr:hypothetical protein [Rhodovulum sp. P5]ARE41415.1 hypothetical protein RGUI_3274 [Rhodovulum sp. P5]
MVEISKIALMTAIQALARVVDDEEAAMDAMEEGPDLYELADSAETYRKALNELRGVYEQARRDGADLPPYGSLVL